MSPIMCNVAKNKTNIKCSDLTLGFSDHPDLGVPLGRSGIYTGVNSLLGEGVSDPTYSFSK